MENNPRAEQLRKNCFLEVVKGGVVFSFLSIFPKLLYCFVFPPAPPLFIWYLLLTVTTTQEELKMLDTERTLEKLCNLYITFRQRYVMAKEGGSFFIPKKKSGEFCRLTNNILRNH